MTPTVRREPLAYYAALLETGQPFTQLLYGDGEFYVAAKARSGETLAYGEVVTPRLEAEMLASLYPADPEVIRATEPFLLLPDTYGGRDVSTVRAIAALVARVLAGIPGGRRIVWHDGTVWDEAVRAGQLGPLLKILHTRTVVVIGNARLRECRFLHPQAFIEIQPQNAFAVTDDTETDAVQACAGLVRPVLIVCAGLGAIPLITRLRRRLPGATFLDLGSTFDLFFQGSPQRGWRAELYADPPRWQTVVAANLAGVCGPDCEEGA